MKIKKTLIILIYFMFSFSEASFANKDCKQFFLTTKGKSSLVDFKKIVAKLSDKKIKRLKPKVSQVLYKCKADGQEPFYCFSKKTKKTNYCILEKLNVMIVLEGIKRNRRIPKQPTKPILSVIDKTDVGLGKLLLKSNYRKVTQSYLAYYEKGPYERIRKGVYRYGGFHPGIDYRAPKFTRVNSPVNGSIHSIDETQWGRLTIKTDDGRYFILLHMSEFAKKSGAVKKGDYLGKTGSVGTGVPHLHVEYRNDKAGAAFYFEGKKDTPKNKINTGFNMDPALIIK